MKNSFPINRQFFGTLVLFFLFTFLGHAQITQVEIQGGAVVAANDTIPISAGNSLTFRVSNSETQAGNCRNLRIRDINLSAATGGSSFSISPNNPSDNIKPANCSGDHDLYFTVTRTDNNCSIASVTVTLVTNDGDFTFTFEVARSSEIYVLGGSPWADITDGQTLTSATNGTYFGVVDKGNVVTRRYLIANIGSCNMDVTNITTNNANFAVSSIFDQNPDPNAISYTGIPPYYGIYLDVTFTAPNLDTKQTATISITTNDPDTSPFSLIVNAEMFNYSIPGPGGVTTDFRMWLQATRGITADGSSKVSVWKDVGVSTEPKNAEQPDPLKQPTYLDDVASNINFNPVVKFENNGTLEQYMYNNDSNLSGFYNHDVFIVMVPDATMTSASTRNTIIAGLDSGSVGDITGIGFGDYSSLLTNETLSYNQNVPGGVSYNVEAETGSSSYSNAGIINVRNDVAVSPTKQEILYNSNPLLTTNVSKGAFTNIVGSKYWIGKNQDGPANLNGRVAEIFTFAKRVNDTDRQKIESYLAIKYGITLGPSREATKDYINSFDSIVWNVSDNVGFNYDVAGIGKDSISDLYQKQSKSVNTPNEVTMGIWGLFDTNNKNPNDFSSDGDFLVWGNNNGPYTGTSTNKVVIATGDTTSLTKIDRKWKVVESVQVAGSDNENIYVGIPENAFIDSGFTLVADEEYVLIASETPDFFDTDIVDVIPLKSDGAGNLNTWYHFEDTKYFTFGKAPRLMKKHAISVAAGGYLIGEFNLNLNVDNFSIATWIKIDPTNAVTRTIMSKGEKLQMRLNAFNKVEILIDDVTIPKYVSNMTISDAKWHHIAFVYESGTILLYVDGVLDKSVQGIVHPSPNYNHFCVGALYVNSHDISNSLLGDVDEVSVWDIALSKNQVHYIMNQEIKKESGNISGTVLPYSASSNEIPAIPWSGLRAYYDFNSFYGSTVEGLTNNRYFLRLKYLNKDKTALRSQTIPAPYVSIADGAWGDESTWANGSEIMLPNTLGLDGTTFMEGNTVEIGHNITSGDRDITLLGLIQTGGTLTMADPNELQDETNSGQGLTISHYLELDGVIKLVGESQLVQTEISVLDADSGGYIERDQQGTANGFNYNYWSSSVGPIAGDTTGRGTGISKINASAKIGEVLFDGTISSPYVGLAFDPSAYAADANNPVGPKPISTYWMYTFYGTDGDYYAWEKIDQDSLLMPGEGWTMKGTSGSAAVESNQNYVFKGLPYNGDFTLPLDKTYKTPGDKNRLIGNPYPSAMDASEFILDNLSIADGGYNTTGTVINGALYFWNHFGLVNSHKLGDYVGGYATYNLIGGAKAVTKNWASYAKSVPGPPPPPADKIPGPYIPVNQGFFVSTALDVDINGDPIVDGNGVPLGSIAGGDIVFKNSQRVYVTEETLASVFIKYNKTKDTDQTININTTPIIRLMYDSPEGYHRQLAIGADKDASNGFDIGYDAFMADVNKEDMYWTFGNAKFVIQGVRDFNDSEEFPLGLVVRTGGTVSIKIDATENLDSSLPIYIKDTSTGATVQINNQPFQTVLAPGTYNDRFQLVFKASQESALSVKDINLDTNVSIYYRSDSSNLTITISSDAIVSGGTILNLVGQRIAGINGFTKRLSMPLHVSSGVYIVQLKTDRGLINKKVIID
tara:strand:- start:46 stop:4989 length:4944 start_codon:yes stop_codon:yes gene_type:complete